MENSTVLIEKFLNQGLSITVPVYMEFYPGVDSIEAKKHLDSYIERNPTNMVYSPCSHKWLPLPHTFKKTVT